MTTTDKLTDRDWLISLLTIEQEQMLTDYEVHPDAWKGDPERTDCTAALADGILEGLAHRRASQAAPAPSDHLVSVGKASGMVEARVSLAARQIRQTLRDYGHRCAETSLPELIAADVDAALRKQDEIHAPAPSDGLREAAVQLLHAICGENGFVEAVRRESGLAYPWPALDIAEDRLRAALSASPAQEVKP